MTEINIEKLNQLISRTDISGYDKVRWLIDFIDSREFEQQEITLEEVFNKEKVKGVRELIDKHKQETLEETREYDLLQHIKFCLECKNESQAIRLIEKYGFQKQEEMYNEEEVELLLETLSKVLVYQGNEYRLPHYFEYEIKEVIKQYKNK